MNILQCLRETSKMKQEEVAYKLNKSVKTVQNWERTMKFQKSEDLHALLDLYDVRDDLRASIVQEVYGDKSVNADESYGINLKNIAICDATWITVDESFNHYGLANQDDYGCYYPPDRIVEAVIVIDKRIECLKSLITYISAKFIEKKAVNVFGINTAKIMDSLANEYDIFLEIEKHYMVTEAYEYINKRYPFGLNNWFKKKIPIFEEKLTYEEALDAIEDKIGIIKESCEEDVLKALEMMKDELHNLEVIKTNSLIYLKQQESMSSDVIKSYEIDLKNRAIWEVVSIVSADISIRVVSDLDCLKRVIYDENSLEYMICDNMSQSTYTKKISIFIKSGALCSKMMALKAINILRHVTRFVVSNDQNCTTEEEWIQICNESEMVQSYIDEFIDKNTTWRD